MKKIIAINEAGLTVSKELNAYLLTCKFYQRVLVAEWEESGAVYMLAPLVAAWNACDMATFHKIIEV